MGELLSIVNLLFCNYITAQPAVNAYAPTALSHLTASDHR